MIIVFILSFQKNIKEVHYSSKAKSSVNSILLVFPCYVGCGINTSIRIDIFHSIRINELIHVNQISWAGRLEINMWTFQEMVDYNVVSFITKMQSIEI